MRASRCSASRRRRVLGVRGARQRPGIAPQFHERIWGIFQTLQARDKVEGTGIGLSVVKKIVESRGGRVTLESRQAPAPPFTYVGPNSSRTLSVSDKLLNILARR